VLTRLRNYLPQHRLLRYGIITLLGLFLTGTAVILGAYAFYAPSLPSVDALREMKMQVPLKVYTHDGKLIAEFGEMKRSPVEYENIPPLLIKAFLSAEDDRFFEHPGVDYQGILRAAFVVASEGRMTQGGSTITMQVARNFFLSSEKKISRKIKEILLSLKIEGELSKEEILELYLNKIFLGQRAYGVAAAAQVYYGKELADLTVAQSAMIAGLPAAPSAYNPVINPAAAQQRRNYVLKRMRELDFIDEIQYQAAMAEPVATILHNSSAEIEAPYVAEMARAEIFAKYGEETYTSGLKAYVTIDSTLQQAANNSFYKALLDYDIRHGYRGPEAHVDLPADVTTEQRQAALKNYTTIGNLKPALVAALSEKEAVVHMPEGELKTIPWDGLKWAQRYQTENAMGAVPKKSADILKAGDIIRVETLANGSLRLAAVPKVSGALVALRPKDGAVMALVGGFDFYQSKFNRVTQAQRQPGSNFKPFIYSAALDKGFTAASIINDAPVVYSDSSQEADWRPENYNEKFYGPTRLREALVNSRNLVSVRILESIGVDYAMQYVQNFGFDPQRIQRDLSLALGTSSLTPMEIVRGYATFANNGFLIEPYVIERVEDAEGNVIMASSPSIACDAPCSELAAPGVTPAPEPAADSNSVAVVVSTPKPARRTLNPQNVYIMTSIMQDVVARGTATGAKQLGRSDLAGKTGTTNESRDAWFSGFNQELVATAWVGFDDPAPLGNRETGGAAALPMWTDFMRAALKDTPNRNRPQPAGLVSVRVDAQTGQLTSADNPNAIFEIFREEDLAQQDSTDGGATVIEQKGNDSLTGQLF
jgi:penicillin-binding protein 1A